MRLSEIVKKGWDALGAGEMDTLVNDYVDDMVFIMPGQSNILEGKSSFRTALDNLGNILPPGFEITSLRHIEGESEVVSIVEWRSQKIISSQLAVLFKFRDDKIFEERWFIDTEQWRDSF